MMMYKYTGLLLLCLLGTAGCGSSLRPLLWLEGTWVMEKPTGGLRLETWSPDGKNLLIGTGQRVAHGDTSLLEQISIYKSKGKVWYAPVVKDQNQGQAVAFRMVSQENNRFIFENEKHDFPQRIVYFYKPGEEGSLNPIDSMDVDVTDLNGKGIHFDFVRSEVP